MPEDALAHFTAAKSLTPVTSPLHGWAAFDGAIALYMNGQYRESATAFHDLLHHDKPALRGFPRRYAAYWLRHAGACAAGHEALAKLDIPRPRKLDVLCGVAGVAISLKSLGLPSNKAMVMRHVRSTGRGSTAQDLVDGCDKLRASGIANVRAHVLTLVQKKSYSF